MRGFSLPNVHYAKLSIFLQIIFTKPAVFSVTVTSRKRIINTLKTHRLFRGNGSPYYYIRWRANSMMVSLPRWKSSEVRSTL
ncbi:hypothetical protein CTI18_04835 [Prevotella intermedia]|uniref:Uncharacterized protein n=1 Tax=Prevotella intermedia TaxID=28131 RepID=A0A2G8IAY9_PREIN|nr:hypothetical protein CTI18_04835 [Prevotella intermedia]